MKYVCLNGEIVNGESPLLFVTNRSYRYGDGLFETIKVTDGNISLEEYHFNRLFESLATMCYKIPPFFTRDMMGEQILLLCEKNKCTSLARLRLSVFRGNGGLIESLDDMQYVIECWPLNSSFNKMNENGLRIDIYPDARKNSDRFSCIKSANFLSYVMAAKHAKENELDDAIVLNVYDRIADTSVANIFVVKDNKLKTPPLNEGCVNGVMRKFLIENFYKNELNLTVEETPLSIDDLLSAEEIFLTNAISGIKWVKQFRNQTYTNKVSSALFKDYLSPIWP